MNVKPEEKSVIDLTIFLPVYNEEQNLIPLHDRLDKSLKSIEGSVEIIYVDDGSTDRSLEALRKIAKNDKRVRVIAFRRNYGQTAAMAAAIDAARGMILVPMDADMQNDPADISRLLDKLDEGYDVVSGWRKERKDKFFTRTLPSVIANKIISTITGVKLHDFGCSLKAYRRDVIKEVRLYGEMHRFIPVYASLVGARITEIPITHHPRIMGRSKYGLSRSIKVIFDLMTIKFMSSYQTKPIYVFAFFGAISLAVAMTSVLVIFYQLLRSDTTAVISGALVIAVIMFALGAQSILLGLIAEMLTRTYHESQAKPIYVIQEVIETPPARLQSQPFKDYARQNLSGF